MRITFASLGTLGDLHPLLALALRARERGHEVVIAASSRFAVNVAAHGMEFVPIRPTLEPEAEKVRYLNHPSRGPERLLREEVFPAVRETYADLLEATSGADLMAVGELLYVAPLVAAKRGIPWANIVLSPTSLLSAIDPCVLAPIPGFHAFRHLGSLPHRLLLEFGNRHTSRWAQPYFDFCKELGVPSGPNPIFSGKHSPHLTLVMFPECFAAPQRDWPTSVVQTGFPFLEQKADPHTRASVESFLASGKPPLVFTLGSSMVQIAGDFYTLAAQAAEQLGQRSILLTGTDPAGKSFAGNALALKYAPLESVVPRCSVMIHHGGIGSCAMALRSGRPSLVIPFGYDQPDNAERLRRAGIGLTLQQNQISISSLTKRIGAILNDAGMRERAGEVARKISPDADLERSLDALVAIGPRN